MGSEQVQTLRSFIDQESKNNVFSEFYKNAPTINQKFKRKIDSNVQSELSKYTHKDAIKFAAKTWIWETNDRSPLPPPEQGNLRIPTFQCEEAEIRAYYRVLGKRQTRYILIACHANLHGFHRGDLRFVEVNQTTITKGFEEYNVSGRLLRGDIVAVTELLKKDNQPLRPTRVFNVDPDSGCVWDVGKMTLLERKQEEEVHFAVLENGKAIVEEHNEEMHVMENRNFPLEMDTIYCGRAFFVDKIQMHFTEDFCKQDQNSLTALYSNMPSYLNFSGTIICYAADAKMTEMLKTGVKAFEEHIPYQPEISPDHVVEKCVLMGTAAANTVSSWKYDRRSFLMLGIQQYDRLVQFSIANPPTCPTEGRWSNNHRVILNGVVLKIDAIIDTVILEESRTAIRIVVRIPRDAPRNINFKNHPWIVQQQPHPDYLQLSRNFFINLDLNSNGRKIIETLYGGSKIQAQAPTDTNAEYYFPGNPAIKLNECQNNYVSMIRDDNLIVLGNSPFGCGKTMTIITAALEVYKQQQQCGRDKKHQLLITQSNNASVSLVDMALKINLNRLKPKIVRYISERNWNVLPDSFRTYLDMPELMKNVFILWATTVQQRTVEFDFLTTRLKFGMVRKVTQTYQITPEQLIGEARRIYGNLREEELRTEPSPRILKEAFFILYQPDIIVTTADSVRGILSCQGIKLNVSNVQIDEASQLPEHTLIYLLQKFHDASIGLVGDLKQLPPHCENELKGLLKKYGIGNTMERALQKEMFPQSTLRYVYRCHPLTTELLSDLFYNGTLISAVQESERNEFMRMRQDIWPSSHFPILVLNHIEDGYRVGTSVANDAEMKHVVRIVKCLTRTVNGYKLKESDIGVISFYQAQTSLLTEAFRGRNIKCGTIDAFQGTEREVMIVCCTNKKLSDFMKLGNRLNVAMSRARQATIIIGNVDGMRLEPYWSNIVQMAMSNSCVYNNIFHFGDDNSFDAYQGSPIIAHGPNINQNNRVREYAENWDLFEIYSRMQNLRIRHDQTRNQNHRIRAESNENGPHMANQNQQRSLAEIDRNNQSTRSSNQQSPSAEQPRQRRRRPGKWERDRRRRQAEAHRNQFG